MEHSWKLACSIRPSLGWCFRLPSRCQRWSGRLQLKVWGLWAETIFVLARIQTKALGTARNPCLQALEGLHVYASEDRLKHPLLCKACWVFMGLWFKTTLGGLSHHDAAGNLPSAALETTETASLVEPTMADWEPHLAQ